MNHCKHVVCTPLAEQLFSLRLLTRVQRPILAGMRRPLPVQSSDWPILLAAAPKLPVACAQKFQPLLSFLRDACGVRPVGLEAAVATIPCELQQSRSHQPRPPPEIRSKTECLCE